jgi:TatD DNase family protein
MKQANEGGCPPSTLVDSHCHLDFPDFTPDWEDMLNRCLENGVTCIQTISTRLKDHTKLLTVTEQGKQHGLFIYCSAGNHPSNVAEEPFATSIEIIKLCKHPSVIGIGETGLDYYRGREHQELQIASFKEHIMAAQETGLPLIVHTRDAEEDTVTMLNEAMKVKPFKILIHCFTASSWLAEECLALGSYISVSGIIAFKNAKEIQSTIRDIVPLSRLLVETDAPYLAPPPYRGKRNEPAFVRHTAEALADLKGVSFEEVAQATTTNFYQLFDKAK